ncbi:helix-turn-helix transcriptional regulator [Streptomyces sp. XM4011]|uniref:helix-turn-helix domain-containing protein n=1 Tax=Streptomyces sp. XM4011 TaxID=2929780 RepID=UPI001FFAD81D|nr:helix-turn-helix transcriptional regulator [Streptomyces sp. XM4011]MCK1816677.1 helix-turn-helix transcriptional regulator [Streptomyces sp. XM4011]
MTGNHLGTFLRARRARVRPSEVGMPSHGLRRVAGLRREEVAVLAGVNADYYTRLEQGRERHPSAQVLDALGRALRLEPDACAHLHRLAGTAPQAPPAPPVDTVSPALRLLLAGAGPATPAFVMSRALDVLAVNALAGALFSPFARVDNLARMTFLDPAGAAFYPRWEYTARTTVAHLREAAGHDPDDVRLRGLVAELSAGSAEFARLWAAHDVRGKTSDTKHLWHPRTGPLEMTYQVFDVRDAPGQQLVVYLAEPGGPAERALRLLVRDGMDRPGGTDDEGRAVR